MDGFKRPAHMWTNSYGIYWGNMSSEKCLLRFEPHRTDREYWRTLKRFLLWLEPFARKAECGTTWCGWAKQAYKAARHERYLLQRKSWENAMPKAVCEWAWSRIDEVSKDDSCVDSQRCGQVGKSSSMRRFRRYRSCCGSDEWRETCPVDGKDYVLGYNCGH